MAGLDRPSPLRKARPCRVIGIAGSSPWSSQAMTACGSARTAAVPIREALPSHNNEGESRGRTCRDARARTAGARKDSGPCSRVSLPRRARPQAQELGWPQHLVVRPSPKDNRCEVTITRIGSGGIGPQAWMCAFIWEVATCNGAPDVNADHRMADGSGMSFGDQWACAGRLCDLNGCPRPL
jgi:hypothetical protein